MKNCKIKCCVMSVCLLLILAFYNFAIMVSCSKPDDRAYVYSVEVLFNDENYTDFKAKINEKIDIGVTVNNYRESYEFKVFYAWIDFNDDKIELNYGINEISFNVGGNYQVKVAIIDGYNRLMTKRMPFSIIDEPPEFLGEINDYLGEDTDKKLNAFWDIGCILPNFEIIDDSSEKIIPEITAQIGQVNFYSDTTNKTSFYYYINNVNDKIKDDIITIKAQDSAGNIKEIYLNIIYNNKLKNWFFNKYEKDNIVLDSDNNKTLYFNGYDNKYDEQLETTFIAYKWDILINNITLNFKKFDKDSFFCLSFEDSASVPIKKYIIEFHFDDQKISIEDAEIDANFNEPKLTISFDKTNNIISVSDSQNTYKLHVESIQNLTAAEFEMSKIDLNAEID